MPLEPSQPASLRFGRFEANLAAREVRKHGVRLNLGGQPFEVLCVLLESHGQAVTREQLQARLWPADTYVDFEHGLNAAVKRLRAVLGDSPESPRYIETIPRVGYRFIAPIEPGETGAAIGPSLLANVALPPAASTMEAAVQQSNWIESTFPPSVEAVSAPQKQEAAQTYTRFWRLFLVGAFSTALVAATASLLILRSHGRGAPGTPIRSIAVLPLENLSGDPSQEYFAEGMTDELITRLAHVPGLRVTSRTSVMQYKAGYKSIPEIGKELGVDAVLEGTVEHSGDRLRLRAQLIEASQDRHVWANAYERDLKDVFTVESDLANSIAKEVQLRLTPQQEASLKPESSVDPEVFEDYLKGRHYWSTRSREGLEKSIEYFNRAIAKDPNYARAYAGLALTYIVQPMITGRGEKQCFPKALEAAGRAMALDESLAESHLAAAEVKLYLDWDFAGAEREFKKTLELNPSYATGHQWYGEFLSLMARHKEATQELETAIELDPLSPIVHHQAGNSFQQARQYDQALAQYREALRLDPKFFSANERMYWAYRRQGKYGESAAALMATYRVPGNNEDWMKPAAIGPAYAREGKAGFVRASMALHHAFSRPAYYLANDYADLGNKEEALKWLQRAFNNRDMEVLFIAVDPEFDSLRSDPSFQELVGKIGIPRPN